MDISLIHAGLAAGTAMAAVPVILHLFMKQPPKRVIFPALRLIRERQKRSRKTLKIKNWLLLLARMALLALMALALARPRLFSQTSLGGDQEVPTAVGLVFDTSLSMGYKPRDKSLLDDAKQQANDILKKMPDSSQVFVIDSAEPGAPPPLSPAAARKRVDGIVLRPANRPLNLAVGQAYASVADCDRPRHEVYVLTDMARSSWDRDRAVEGLDKVKKVKSGIATYIVRMAPKDIHDVAVTEASPSVSVATQGESVEIRAKIRSQGPATSRMVQFDLDGKLRDQKQVTLAANGETELIFMTPKLDPAIPIHKGVVRLSGAPDPLSFNDSRFFTFKVQPAMKVLVISDRENDAQFVADALDPDPGSLPTGTPRSCQVESIRTAKFEAQTGDALKNNTAVFLLNVKELSETGWSRLNAFVREGGGLVIGLGEYSSPENYNLPEASQLIPGSLTKKESPKEISFGKISDLTHPLFRSYPRQLGEMLSQIPIYHYWGITPPKGSRTLLAYSNGAPALVERSFQGKKNGRVLLWTTPLSRVTDSRLKTAWNEFALPVGENWSFFLLMKQTIPYLAGTSSEQLNYEVGQDAILPIDPTRRFKNYVMQSEDGKTTERLNPPVDSLVIVSPPTGQWTVTASNSEGEKTLMGFSVNPPLSEMNYAPMEASDFDAIFGKKGYNLATDAESLKREVTMSRVGFEMFPWLMGLILILVTLESLLANKFHRESAPRGAVGAPA
ncbi:BatA domain-containing protein [Singulisphaera sp. Ch08]|uniref:BatA domain-containing protein n=1 Tax=Singulisphaera sp. Ch08 TaxID=3120278 RepID=A0AAU7CCT3_9BACT